MFVSWVSNKSVDMKIWEVATPLVLHSLSCSRLLFSLILTILSTLAILFHASYPIHARYPLPYSLLVLPALGSSSPVLE